MTPAGSAPSNGPHGIPVRDEEDLFRCIAYPNWWNEEEHRITSAAFKFPCFSVDVASLAGSPEATLSRFLAGTGLVTFPCRVARELGCDVRLEPDPACPERRCWNRPSATNSLIGITESTYSLIGVHRRKAPHVFCGCPW
jgi:hypothetical protein